MPITRRIACGMGLGILAFALGLAGASLFHPDDGPLRSTAIWQVFGLTAYAGIALLWLSIIAAALALVVGLFGLPRHLRR